MVINKIKFYILKKKWRRLNGHNFTTISRKFPFDLVHVGKNTYGTLDIHSWGNEEEKITIGNFVSIASGVKFLLGGNHRYDTISSYPFRVKILGEKVEALTKGPVIIENDVWIGTDAIILSGIKIGQGAIIAAGSVISKDVPPYAIMGGNPAKLIKYRFSESLRNKLTNLDYEKIDNQFIEENIELFYKPLNEEILSKLIRKLD